MRTKIQFLFVLALSVAAMPWSMGIAQGAPRAFVVIVNRSNPTHSLARAEVSRMFLKQVARWGNGQAVMPVDLGASSAVRGAFSTAVHSRSASSVSSYWRQQIFAGRGVPPPEQTSEADVIRFVASHAGGIGYVSPSANVASVAVLQVSGL